jgi:hypothetical protein
MTAPAITIGYHGMLPFRLPVTLRAKHLQSHMRVLGISGQGKSKTLAHLAATLIRAGVGCAVIDPHASLVLDILSLLYDAGYFRRPDAFEKLLYIDFSRKDRFVPFNVLTQPYADEEVARHVVEACMRVWTALAEGAAPRLENTLLATVPVLRANNLPLPAATRLLTDQEYREALLRGCTDPTLADFFHNRFDRWGRDQATMVDPVLTRIFLFSYTSALRYSLGQTENLLQFPLLMERGVSLLCNLHGLDEETQKLLGCLLTVGLENAALNRDPTRPHAEYHLIIDEFASFCTPKGEVFSKLLSQARKFQVFLLVSHQTNSQLPEGLLQAIGNMTTEIFFRLSHDDAIYEAPRLFEHDPYRVKDSVKDEAQRDKHVPLYMSIQEGLDEKARALKNLHPQEAYVKMNRMLPSLLRRFYPVTKTSKLQTKTVRTRTTREQLEQVKDYYAKKLLRTQEEIEEEMNNRVGNSGNGRTRTFRRDRSC